MSDETLVRRDVFWGVDFSVSAASIGWVTADGTSRGVVTAVWDHTLRGGARLADAQDSIYDLGRKLALDRPAVFTYIEQPSGTFNKPELSYMCGALQAGIYNALSAHWHEPIEIRTVPSGTWKKSVLGRGDYGKPKRNDDFEYQALIWCRENDVEVEDVDEADAVCIAEHARLSITFV